VPEPLARHLLHGYLACASYVDAQIGRVLAELDRLGLGDNTIVVFTSDHGFHLGDLGQWCKATNFEVATRVPLIIRTPQMKAQGAKSRGLVELVGLYPTLCDLTKLPKPAHLEGASFASLLDEPDKPLFDTALSQFPRNGTMGRSLRTDRYRYTEWQDQKNGEIIARELYDHDNDPHEAVNLAGNPKHLALVASLAESLRHAFRTQP
jgi:arylsulfatase A-like enzyme